MIRGTVDQAIRFTTLEGTTNMPNYGPYGPTTGYGPNSIGTAVQPQPVNYQQYAPGTRFQQNGFNQIQPVLPTLSIAPVSGDENATQFPVGAGTELYLIDKQNGTLYIKSNPNNPRDMEKFRLERIIEEPNPNDPVSRAELDEMKSMMAQMMQMIQGSNSQNQNGNKKDSQSKQYSKRSTEE